MFKLVFYFQISDDEDDDERFSGPTGSQNDKLNASFNLKSSASSRTGKIYWCFWL